MKIQLEFRWTVSHARDTEGYNICTLYADEVKVARCNGGGYDMQGTCLGTFIADKFAKELVEQIKEPLYGLRFLDPHYNPSNAIVADGKTVEQLEKEGKSLGLDRYQACHADMSPLPTKRHTVPYIDGACGLSSVEAIMNAIHLTLKSVNTKPLNRQSYIMEVAA